MDSTGEDIGETYRDLAPTVGPTQRGVRFLYRGVFPRTSFSKSFRREPAHVETHGPLGTLWAGLGLGAFYTALIWVNLLLGHMLTPLFILPLTWLQDAMKRRRESRA
jgi:hypothetical protein